MVLITWDPCCENVESNKQALFHQTQKTDHLKITSGNSRAVRVQRLEFIHSDSPMRVFFLLKRLLQSLKNWDFQMFLISAMFHILADMTTFKKIMASVLDVDDLNVHTLEMKVDEEVKEGEKAKEVEMIKDEVGMESEDTMIKDEEIKEAVGMESEGNNTKDEGIAGEDSMKDEDITKIMNNAKNSKKCQKSIILLTSTVKLRDLQMTVETSTFQKGKEHVLLVVIIVTIVRVRVKQPNI